MAYPELDSVNLSNDITDLLVYGNVVTDGYLVPLLLFSFFVVLMMGSYFSQKRLTGEGDMAVSFGVSSFITTGLSLIMMLKDGLVNTLWVIVLAVLSMIGLIWIMSNNQN